MNKFCCCCSEPDLPDISVNVTCACCESRVEEHSAKDEVDLDITTAKTEDELPEEEEEDTVCCCFRRKRHANSKKRKKQLRDGSKT